MLQPGTTIGRYVVKRLLAEGGMAEIYLGTATGPEGFEKDVVIKRVRSFLAKDANFVDMFKAEARLASRLNHANIVQVFDFAEHQDTYFIAMEFVHGVSLWELRRRAKELGLLVSPTLVGEIGAAVARGLHYAHSLSDRGLPLRIVHRDVTPHNVLLSFDGAIKLTDFGIAKASSNFTTPGMLKGKFAYMAPEQARGEMVDGRTDLFALGIVLWELLTGGRLFEADSDVAVLRAVQDSVIVPPQRLNPLVPAELNQVVVRALSRPPQERFQNAQEMERALANFALRNATSVEDKSVASFLARLYSEELSGPKRGATSTLGSDLAPVHADTVRLDRSDEHLRASDNASGPLPVINEGPRATPSIDAPAAQVEKTAKLPSRKLSPVISEAEERVWPDSSPDVEVLRPTSRYAPSSRILVDDNSLGGAEVVATELKHRKLKEPARGWVPWVLAGCAVLGTGLGVIYAWVPASTPVIAVEKAALAPPVAQKAEKELPPPTPAVVPVAQPTVAALPTTPVIAADITAPKAAATAAKGVLEIVATPYAQVTLSGKNLGDVQGKKRLTLSPGTYGLIFSHPKRTESKTVVVKAGRTETAEFSAF
jgi:serine/threonine-protein kinase